jgi:hypothetical protein
MKNRCSSCRFSVPDELLYQCHRNAPKARITFEGEVVQARQNRVEVYWPVVCEDDFCGEFKPKMKSKK